MRHVLKLFILGLLLSVVSVRAQDDAGGRGVIREGAAGADEIDTFNPLACQNVSCGRVVGLLFPSLIGVDLEARTYAPGGFGGIAESWTFDLDTIDLEQPTLTVQIATDQTWSDGTPISAYDVYFTYLALTTGVLSSPYAENMRATFSAATVLDERTISYVLRDPNCDVLAAVDTLIMPAHIYDANFRDRVDGLGDNLADRYVRDALWQAITGGVSSDTFFARHPSSREPRVTASPYGLRYDDLNSSDSVRLLHENGTLAYEYVDVPSPDDSVDLFLQGDLNIIVNPLFLRRDDIRAAAERGEVELLETTGNTWYSVVFNLADAREPQSAFGEDGEALDQGYHIAFGDIRVRQAFQLGLDVAAIIDAALNGNGTIMPANQTPTSWAYNPSLAPISTNPAQSARLLTEAGWVDEDGDGVRECYGCLYAPEGTSLQISLLYPDSTQASIVASLMRQQLSRLGISLNLQAGDTSFTDVQNFDAALIISVENYPVEPDQFNRFARAGDFLYDGENIGSYVNTDVENLLYQARTVADCEANVRADLYRQAQTLIQADYPYAWLFVVDQMIAARSSIDNFDPRWQVPYWNVGEWVVIQR